eukprot:CAMPEP_0115839596 /NCGR_PEP_ID=MMETSP0287-20121206/6334_1 /TAXON_ID=412157 /ORGANISM="Chrysochromulina rotalis, Strain UIO044" /LENGTH=362 /DNA_ID=CAMNT_0003293175 /DNA_START=89 /DNA_END=1177 /DNA_ORIENTATION=-
MNEFRHNLATDEWVVYSAARRGRPKQTSTYPKTELISELCNHDPACPFCVGNESMTPAATLVKPSPSLDLQWQLRVVPNKFPAVSTASGSPSIEHLPRDSDAYQLTERVDAIGFHEVLIETPQHNLPLALQPAEHVEEVVRAFRSRGRAMLHSDATLRHIMYFKNSGTKAGASLHHPHSQILGLPIVPIEVATRQRHAREWRQRFQENVFQHTLDETLRQRDEASDGRHRVVLESDHFLCFVPFAALSPFSLWIVPKKLEAAHFHEASDEQCAAFASMLRQALRCLHFGLDEPDFNMLIRSAALETGGGAIYRKDLYFRWYCLLIPRLGVGQLGGFEFSTGIQSNSSFPEDDAAYLRSLGEP